MDLLDPITSRYKNAIREKASKRAETRIIIAGRRPEDFAPEDLEIVVQEEEEKIKTDIRDKGLLSILALLGISWFG
jgi:lysyl-tRNA synthetase class I